MGQVLAQRDLRNDMTSILRRVAEGERFTVTVRGEPVAELIPLTRPTRFVPWADVDKLLREAPVDVGLLDELQDMDVDHSDEHIPA